MGSTVTNPSQPTKERVQKHGVHSELSPNHHSGLERGSINMKFILNVTVTTRVYATCKSVHFPVTVGTS